MARVRYTYIINRKIKEVNFIYRKMQKEHERIGKELEKLENRLEQLPQGKLIVAKSKGYVRFYRSDGHDKSYLKKENQKMIQQLAYKRYLQLQIKDLSQEKKAIDSYLRHHQKERLSEQFLIENPEYQQLISRFYVPQKKKLVEWMNASYKKSNYETEKLVHPTSAGFCVRSKSEVMIVECLLKYQIPFRYECELIIGKDTYYPDYTIRHPRTGELFYWEHFGCMDDPKYRRKCYNKLQRYGDYGIIPTINLITTYENGNHPLTLTDIEKMIQEYFL